MRSRAQCDKAWAGTGMAWSFTGLFNSRHLLKNVGWALVRCRDALAVGLATAVSIQALPKRTSGNKAHPGTEQHGSVSIWSRNASTAPSAPGAFCKVFHPDNEEVQPSWAYKTWWFHSMNQMQLEAHPCYSNFIIAIYFGACVNCLIFSYIILRVESILAWSCLAEQGLALLMRMKQTLVLLFWRRKTRQFCL